MKIKSLFFSAFMMLSMIGFSQNLNQINARLTEIDSTLLQVRDYVEVVGIKHLQSLATEKYKMYPTDNMWNFLQLNTATGQIYQVQFSMDSKDRVAVDVNSEDLSLDEGMAIGTFELYPTQNMYTFLMLDKIYGRVWQVQWGMSSEDRLIVRIK